MEITSIHIDKAENGSTIRCCFAQEDGKYIQDENYVTDKKLEELAAYLGIEVKEEKEEEESAPPIASFNYKKFR